MDNANTFWLTLSNVALGVLVGLCLLGVLLLSLCEIAGKLRKRHVIFTELDRDMRSFFGRK